MRRSSHQQLGCLCDGLLIFARVTLKYIYVELENSGNNDWRHHAHMHKSKNFIAKIKRFPFIWLVKYVPKRLLGWPVVRFVAGERVSIRRTSHKDAWQTAVHVLSLIVGRLLQASTSRTACLAASLGTLHRPRIKSMDFKIASGQQAFIVPPALDFFVSRRTLAVNILCAYRAHSVLLQRRDSFYGKRSRALVFLYWQSMSSHRGDD